LGKSEGEGGRKVEGVGVMKDKEVTELDEMKASLTLGGGVG
jgi:hypothetical protein